MKKPKLSVGSLPPPASTKTGDQYKEKYLALKKKVRTVVGVYTAILMNELACG